MHRFQINAIAMTRLSIMTNMTEEERAQERKVDAEQHRRHREELGQARRADIQSGYSQQPRLSRQEQHDLAK